MSTHNDWQQTRYAAAIRQAEQDTQARQMRRETGMIEPGERETLLRYVKEVARKGAYERLMERIKQFDTGSTPYGLTPYQWGLLQEAYYEKVLVVGRGGGPAAAALKGHGLLDQIGVGRYTITEIGRRLMDVEESRFEDSCYDA